MTIEELKKRMQEDRKRYEALPWYLRAFEDLIWWVSYGIWNKVRDIRFGLRVRFSRALYGYDESDWWEYYSNNSERAVVLLTLLRDKGHGYPGGLCDCPGPEDCHCDSNTKMAQWRAILDDMIFFHRICCGDTSARMDLSGPELERFEAGRKAYCDYYENLWD
jgi:hypothetical protein